MFDSVAFLAESALFFVMSRALSEDRWRTYYGTVLVLLVVDSIWGAVSWYCHGGPTTVWITLNLSFAVVLLLRTDVAAVFSAASLTAFGIRAP